MLLDEEYAALLRGDSTALEACTAEKASLVGKLADVRPERGLLAQIGVARKRVARNARVLAERLNDVNQRLGFFESALRGLAPVLYGADGERQAQRPARILSRA